VGGDDYLESDAVFGVKTSLIAPFETVDGGEITVRSRFDFVLVPA
jgi:hydroxyquinol 1,2-dioxygenase